MRIFLSLLAVVTITYNSAVPVHSQEPAKAPDDFSYTEIHTALSENGIPVFTDVKRVAVSGPHKRTERFEGPFEVTDALTSRMVSVDPKNKTYTVHDRQRVINTSNGSSEEVAIPKRPAVDDYEALTWMPEGSKHVALEGETTINGHPSRGHRITIIGTEGTNTTTYWTAVDTKRLTQVSTTWTPKGAKAPQLEIVRTAFDYDPIIDKSVFSLVPPSGYELKSQPILGLTSPRD